MKKIVSLFFLLALGSSLWAQKVAFVDTEAILKKIPAYTDAEKQLDELSGKWKARIELGYKDVEQMYQQYRSEEALYSEEMKKRKQDEIIAKEQAVKDLQKKYFGPEGDLFKKRQELIAPIQDDIFNAIKTVADEGNYSIILDKASGTGILYAVPRYDLSQDVLETMGY